MALEALFGFAGVLLGSLTTSILTIYREKLVNKHDLVTREQQHARQQREARDAFQRESILGLQAAISAVIEAAYTELDRLLKEHKDTCQRHARQWETPTATGWSSAILSLETVRARVFDDDLRTLAEQVRTS